MRLEIVKKLLMRDQTSATEELVQLQELCKTQVNDLRSFVRSMRPVDIEGSLNSTLRRVVEQFQKDSGIPASFVSSEFLEPAEPWSCYKSSGKRSTMSRSTPRPRASP